MSSDGSAVAATTPSASETAAARKQLQRFIRDRRNVRQNLYAPDTRVTEHPIKLGSGNLTALTGVFEGTFTRPMPDGQGGFIQPTGKPFKLPMATIGIWKNGVMVEEHLFWDNQAFARQVGLTQ